MALPTAQLGSLPNMSMPYSVPTYSKSSATQEAIAGFLAGLATNVGSNLGSNLMSRDYAEQPAGFFSKLVAGPKENRQQYGQRLERVAAERMAETEYTRRSAESDKDRIFRQGLEDRRLEDAARQRQIEMFLRAEDNKAALERAQYEWQERAAIQDAEMRARREMIEAEYGLRAGLPSEKIKATEAELLRSVINQQLGAQNPVQPAPLTPEEQAEMMTGPITDRQLFDMAAPLTYVDKMIADGTDSRVVDRFKQGLPSLQSTPPEIEFLRNFLSSANSIVPSGFINNLALRKK